MAKKPKAVKKRKPLRGVRIPLPRQTGGKHKVKTKYDRKRVGNLMKGLSGMNMPLVDLPYSDND